MNLIPFNPFPNSEFKKSPRDRIAAFQRLSDAGIAPRSSKRVKTTLTPACGQLAGQIKDRTRRTIAIKSAQAVKGVNGAPSEVLTTESTATGAFNGMKRASNISVGRHVVRIVTACANFSTGKSRGRGFHNHHAS